MLWFESHKFAQQLFYVCVKRETHSKLMKMCFHEANCDPELLSHDDRTTQRGRSPLPCVTPPVSELYLITLMFITNTCTCSEVSSSTD